MVSGARLHLGMNTLIMATAAAAAFVLSYLLTHRGLAWAGVALAAPCAAAWVLHYRGNGLLLAVIVLLVVPYWYPHVWEVAPLAATIGLVTGAARTRLRAVDVAVCLFAAALTASWVFHPEFDVRTKVFVEGILPLGFYAGARLTITDRLLPRLQWVILSAGAVGAGTVLYEATQGAAVFSAPQTYQWAGSSSTVFRAGGIFGGSPTAAVVLSMALLASTGLYRTRPKLVAVVIFLILAAVAVTFDRAGPVGLALGLVLIAVLLPYRQWGRVVFATLAVSIPVYAVTSSPTAVSSVTSSQLVNAGIIRTGTFMDRLNLAADSVPLLADSTSHLLFGRGFFSLSESGTHDSRLVARVDLWDVEHGPNDDYLRALLEQGLLGFLPMIAWLGGSLLMGIRTSLRLPKRSRERTLVAGLTAATLCYMVGSLTGDQTKNWTCLAAAGLFTGMLVSVCTLYYRGRCFGRVSLGESQPRRPVTSRPIAD